MIRCFGLLCCSLLLVGSLQARTFSYQQATVITQKGVKIPVEVSDTPAKRQQGLSDRPRLKPGWGMLFVFERSGRHDFWMKDMNFPIDILWLRNSRVVYVAEKIAEIKNISLEEVAETTTKNFFSLFSKCQTN